MRQHEADSIEIEVKATQYADVNGQKVVAVNAGAESVQITFLTSPEEAPKLGDIYVLTIDKKKATPKLQVVSSLPNKGPVPVGTVPTI